MKHKISLLLVDDHQLFRQSLTALINTATDFKIIGEAENGMEALKLLKTVEPDVVLLDLEMPLMNGKETTIEIKKQFPWIKIIIVTTHDEPYFSIHLLKLGADGFLSKSCTIQEVKTAIQVVYDGLTYFNEEARQKHKDEIDSISERKFALNQLSLSPIERKIVKQITTGKTGNEISEYLNMSLSNYNNHKKNIRTKTGCKTDPEIVLYALKQGIVS